jgi:DeoD family purine-nucleoside phosphorylase
MHGSLESRAVHREPIHLKPTNPLAERVLLPGDPGRALALAQWLLQEPLMFNHHRGLWGYTGKAPDGEPLSIQSTGMGGPSAAIVLEELIVLGVRLAIRVGTCGALNGELALGDLLIAREAITADGTSRALGSGERIGADLQLTEALERQSGQTAVTIVSTDLFYDPDDRRSGQWSAAGAVAVEMEAATLFAVGARANVQVGCALVVSDLLADNSRTRIGEEDLLTAAEAMGRVAAAAFGDLP